MGAPGKPLRAALGEEAAPGPWPVQTLAAEDEAIVQPERAVAPEFESERRDAVAAPVGRARHLAYAVLQRILGDALFQGHARLQRTRLQARPGAEPGAAIAAAEIGVGLG